MLTESLAQFFEKNPSLENQSTFAVAVSGGPDSMALAQALIKNYPAKNFHLITVNHGLREASQAEAQKVGVFFTYDKNATHKILNWEGDKPENAVLEEARKARYKLMSAYCKTHHIQTLFVAHHQNDQAETFLIRLAKGSGLDGLTAMKSISQRDNIMLARPFLAIPKEELIAYCQQNKIEYCDDPTNKNADYLRPRLRQSMAILEQEGLSIKRLSITAKRLEKAQEALLFYSAQTMEKARIKSDGGGSILDFTVLKNVPYEISLRVLQNLIESHRTGYDYNVRLEKLEDLHHSLISNPIHFKPRTLGGCLVSLKNNTLIIEKEKK